MRKQKRIHRKYLWLLVPAVALLLAVLPRGAAADPVAEFSEKERQLSEKAAQVQSLSGELGLLEETADAKLDALANIQGRVAAIQQELDETTERLTKLLHDRDQALGSLRKVMLVDYVGGSPGAWEVLASPGGMSETLSEQSVTGSLGDYAKGLADDLVEVEETIDDDRQRLVSRKRALEGLLAEAERQVQELAAVREVKKDLLEDSQGEEGRFRKQYEAAREQLVKLGLFARGARDRIGVRVWDGTGNYFNQLDARWIDATLGFSSTSTIGDFGCGVVSAAMVWKHYGINTDPFRLNADLKRVRAFVGDLLNWRNVHLASRGKLALANNPYGGVNWGHIDRQLVANNPVIVFVDRPGQYSHYVTLLRKDGAGYVMHDPIEGPFLRFGDYYSKGAVFQYITFRRM